MNLFGKILSEWRAFWFRCRVRRQNVRALARALARLELAATPAQPLPLTSRPCRQLDFSSDWYHRWCGAIGQTSRFHRKQWEYCYILQALDEQGCLAAGKRGLGFGVGREPLVAAIAARGASVHATDLDLQTATEKGWALDNQHSNSVDVLNLNGLCPQDEFRKRVSFSVANMNAISSDLVDFDFVWSSCAFEHLGTIELGLRFVKESARCLRPGGVAVHTTEFNVDSDTRTIERGPTVLFRRRDLQRLEQELAALGCAMTRLDFEPGAGVLDEYIDLPPYKHPPHLRLPYREHTITSFGIIVKKLS